MKTSPGNRRNTAPSFISSRSGHRIDTSSRTWRIGPYATINWELLPEVLHDLRPFLQEYIRHLIRSASPDYARNQFTFLKTALAEVAEEVAERFRGECIDRQVFDMISDRLRARGVKSYMNHLTAYRLWYSWCTDMGFDHFDADVAYELAQIRVGGNDTGSSVLSNDPDDGPLNEEEFSALTGKLLAAHHQLDRGNPHAPLDRFSIAVTWLFIALGSNPKTVALLDEDDLQKEVADNGSRMYWLRVPRIKKRDAVERTQFKTRKLIPEIGQLLSALINDNSHFSMATSPPSAAALSTRYARPLLRRPVPRTELLGTAFESEAYRYTPRELGVVLKQLVEILNLTSVATGRPLRLTPRRLRYTFATRMVQEGASPLELAEALDHSDTSFVMVYFNARSDAVRRLDKALAITLGPRAQAFLGMIVRRKDEAERGSDPASLIYHVDGSRHIREPVGNCGNFGFCGLYAPIACYTCTFFRPWLDGPHEEVLDDLLAVRNRRLERGGDIKLIQIHDETILAVGDVIDRCRKMRGGSTGGQGNASRP